MDHSQAEQFRQRMRARYRARRENMTEDEREAERARRRERYHIRQQLQNNSNQQQRNAQSNVGYSETNQITERNHQSVREHTESSHQRMCLTHIQRLGQGYTRNTENDTANTERQHITEGNHQNAQQHTESSHQRMRLTHVRRLAGGYRSNAENNVANNERQHNTEGNLQNTIEHIEISGQRMRLTHIRRFARGYRRNAENDVANNERQHNTGGNLQNTIEHIEISGQRMRLTHVRRLAREHIHLQIPLSNSDQASLPNTDAQPQSEHPLNNAMNISTNPIQPPGNRIMFNCARDFKYSYAFQKFHMPDARICFYCGAKIFYLEPQGFCCSNGRISLPVINSPPELMDLFQSQSEEGVHFRKNIRSYNHVFAFTSIGVNVDEALASSRRGVYTFRAQGAVYHKIGSFLPIEGSRPRYLQMYVYDTEHETENRLAQNDQLNIQILEKIKFVLDVYNPFVRIFRQLGQREDLLSCKLIIKEQPMNVHQYNMPTVSQVAAIYNSEDDVGFLNGREIIVQALTGELSKIQDTAGYYDPLQYPLLLPYGSYGWDQNTQSNSNQHVTCCDYYAYMLQIREFDQSLFLRGGRLLQQYVVDNHVKIESHKLRYLRGHQRTIRSEMYQGLQDLLNAGENDADNVGTRIILPSSYIGSPRDMYQRYQDAMGLVQKFGKPDLFITMTCNPSWVEITKELLPGQTTQDRPDLLTRVFRSKCEELKKDIFQRGVLGTVVAHVHVIEFQKRGLPHIHILVILDERDKLHSPDDYDRIVKAELPDREIEPELYVSVLKHMVHGPCGSLNLRAPCMKNGTCKKNYPKQFSPITVQGDDSYPIYRRRDDGHSVALRNDGDMIIDNRWVVPYNPWLILKYDCHINVEICSSIICVKYLYKYVYKGPDRVALEVRSGIGTDEIKQFIDARWVCAPEAMWRIYKFALNKVYPSIQRLQIHLPNKQQVRYYCFQSISTVLSKESSSRTMLTEFFRTNFIDEEARQYLYREFPEHYRWLKGDNIWRKRVSHQKVIGRIYTVSPSEGERFYLRILLNHIRGPTSFDNLLTINGIRYPTFKQVAEQMGLLADDLSTIECLREAACTHMAPALRRLFATILLYCEPTGVRALWDEMYPHMIEDYSSSSTIHTVILRNRLLNELNGMLQNHQKSIADYDLPGLVEDVIDMSTISNLIEDELSIPITVDDLKLVDCLNDTQLLAYRNIMTAITNKENSVFFIDGPGGTGKTYLYRAIIATIRQGGQIVLATASSGIAAILLPGGCTAHSRFKIPILLDIISMCRISKQSELADLLRQAIAIIWDEATMTHRHAFEALDRTLRDITGYDLAFGGKVIILGGDFRQVLPVVPRGTRAATINASLVKSQLWKSIKVFHLTENMRAKNDPTFSAFLLRVGNGDEPCIVDDMIRLPDEIVLPWKNNNSVNHLVEEIFSDMTDKAFDKDYMVQRAIITPKNADVDKLNEQIISSFPGPEQIYYSYDKVDDDTHNLYQNEFLNSITPGGLPPHKLILKVGAPVMLLRNIDPKIGLCNGTRLICRSFNRNFIDAEIVTGHHSGTRVFIPRIPLEPPENLKLPFKLVRRQFPIRLSFALTINKAQGQTIPHVGIYLPEPVFSHGQLYVALSRGVSMDNTRILVKNGKLTRHEGTYTKNVVYKEVLLEASI